MIIRSLVTGQHDTRAQLEKVHIFILISLSAMRLPVQVQGIVFRKVDGEIQYLLLKRIQKRDGFWQPVTGGLEEGETRIEALEREVSEETGIKDPVRIIEDVYCFEFKSSHQKEYVYGVEILPDEKVVLDGREHSECRWCNFEETLKLLKWESNKEAVKKLNEILNACVR